MSDRPMVRDLSGILREMNDAEYEQYQVDGQAANKQNAVPTQARNFAMRKALIAMGKFDTVDQTVQKSGDALVIQAWAQVNPFDRASALVGELEGVAGFTDADTDDAFRMANGIAPLQNAWQDAWAALQQQPH